MRRGAARQLSHRHELQATLFGLLGPLIICGYTIFHPFDLRQSYHRLQQCAIWLAGWYLLFAIGYVVREWLRPLRDEQADLRHLPLSSTHFFLARASELCLIPLRCTVLTLPLWLVVLVYIQVPYDQQWLREEWSWGTGEFLQVLWPVRLAWVTAAIVSATLLPLAYVLLLQETLRSQALRLVALLLPILGLYALMRYFPEQFRMPYRTTAAIEAISFFVIPALTVALCLLAGQWTPRARITTATVLALLAAAIVILPRIGGFGPNYEALRLPGIVDSRSLNYGATWLAGSLSPPRNIRLLFDSLHSNVLLTWGETVWEPAYPEALEYEWDAPGSVPLMDEYAKKYQEYERHIIDSPRLPLWVGPGLLPLLLPLLIFAGLVLGHERRRVARDV